MNRRGFLSAITLGAVATPAVTMGVKASSDPSDGPVEETLTIRTGVEPQNPDAGFRITADGSLSFTESQRDYKMVNMSVGKDGNLWIKTECGQWKRVVTE